MNTRTCPDCKMVFKVRHNYETRCVACWLKVKAGGEAARDMKARITELELLAYDRIMEIEELEKDKHDYIELLEEAAEELDRQHAVIQRLKVKLGKTNISK